MKKMKTFILVLHLVFAVEILGAWNMTPEAEETFAEAEGSGPHNIEEENQVAVQEIAAKEDYVRLRTEEIEKSNEYYVIMNQNGQEEWERIQEDKRKKKERERKRRREERKVLERIVEAEAGDQDLKGRVLVANVIMNRVKSKHFPNSVRGVVFAHRQFSPISNGSYYRVHVSKKTKKAVEKAMDGADYSKGALYFMCRRASSPSNVAWFDRALTKVKEYGCHEFFK